MISQNNPTKGILFFAKNNPDFNYIKQATVSATLAKYYLNVPVALITDTSILEDDISIFDHVIDYKSTAEKNVRPYYIDGKAKIMTWHNLDRLLAYELSPYDETILLDTDYLIQNDVLNTIWGNDNPMLMNTSTRKPDGPQEHVYEKVIADGFPQVHWFTVMYFRKCEESARWFDLAKYVKENYDFYSTTYRVPYTYYRNDMTAAIASHLAGGMQDGFMKPLPVRQINSYPPEEIIKIEKDVIVLSTDKMPVRLLNTNLHMVNKGEIEKHFDRFMEVYS